MTAPRRSLATTTDPAQIQDPSNIPPSGSLFVGLSPQGLVDVYTGTLPGDVDAAPAAKELWGTAPGSPNVSNADYVYTQVATLYGGADLPSFQSPSGNSVKSVVFVSGSAQGGYGAFHLQNGVQADFDRIVLDSLTSTGNYSAGSGLGTPVAHLSPSAQRLFPIYTGASELLGIFHAADARLKSAKPEAIRQYLKITAQCAAALQHAVVTRNPSLTPKAVSSAMIHKTSRQGHSQLSRQLVQANQELLSLVVAAARASAGRQYLSTALFAAEIVESFQILTGKADPGHTDGEAVSRVLAFKLAPEIALVPGFNSAITQQWWQDGHPDFANDNTQNDQSTDGNAAGVMFLEFLNDYLGVPLDRILQRMPPTHGAALGQTYSALLADFPDFANSVGADGPAAFAKMISLLQQNTQNPDGTLNLPADGNPFPSMPNSRQGGLFAAGTSTSGALAQDVQAALGLQSQLEQQFAALKIALQQIQGDVTAPPTPAVLKPRASKASVPAKDEVEFGYRAPLGTSMVASLERRVAPYLAPQYDQSLQDEFWKHVYNELPGTGPNTDRLQVITGTNQMPLAVQITGTVLSTRLEPDGDLHISFQPDDANFPSNQGAGESPLEIEIIYVGPVTQVEAKQAQVGYTNPFDISQLGAGTRILAAGPLIFDRAHGNPAPDGKNVTTGLEIHPLVGLTILAVGQGGAPSVAPTVSTALAPASSQLSSDLSSAEGQAATLGQTLGNLNALLQKMKSEAPTS